jgi:RNA polymerase sigma-70 factor (ECF subfamily)
MATRSGAILGHLWKLLAEETGGDQTDGLLLDRFVARQEEAAFALLMERHGPLVFDVCRRLPDHRREVP